MSHKLQLSSVRKALEPRTEPYWAAPIAKGKYIGLRKIDAKRASWIARRRDEAGKQALRGSRLRYRHFDFDAAKLAAEAAFKKGESGIADEVVTIADACRQYVTDRRREKGERTATDAEQRFKRTVYGTAFGALALAKVRVSHIKAWRDGLNLSKAASNRTLGPLRAALNMAVTHRHVSPDKAQEWRDVQAYKGADGRRDLFLDLRQRQALLRQVVPARSAI